MVTSNRIQVIPSWWKYIPLLGTEITTAIYPNIYFPKEVYSNLLSKSPSILNQSILIHETVHIERQIAYGVFKWNVRYLCDKKFRLEEELIAIKTQMLFLKRNNETYDCKRKAKHFSSSVYLWVLSYDKSLTLLTDLWNEIC